MDKQEAVEFILSEMQNNRSQDEIIASLSQKLGAPPEVVRKFVVQVTGPGLSKPISIQKQPAPDAEEIPQHIETPSRAAPPDTPAPVSSPPRVAEPVEVAAQAPTYSSPAIPGAISVRTDKADPELEKWILNALGKNHRMDDIIMKICEQTGMNWDQAQRLVARVRTANRKQLTTRQNILTIILSLAAMAAGIALFAASVNEALNVINFWANPAAFPEGLSSDIDRLTIAAFISGPILFLGGFVGLFLSLKSMFE